MDIVEILREQAVAIGREVEELSRRDGVDFIEVSNACNEIRLHVLCLDRALLPELRKLDVPNEVLRVCEADHEELLDIVERINPRERSELPELLSLLNDRIRVHFQVERNGLLGRVRDYLSPVESNRLARLFEESRARESKNLPTPGVR